MTNVKETRAFTAFQSHNFRLFFAGQSVSLAGTWMQHVAQAWLVLQLTGSGTMLGLIIAAQSLPILLLGPYGGVLADRIDKRRLLMFSQVAMGLLALTLGLLTVSDLVQVWMVAVLAVMLGCVSAISNPTQQAFVLEMVGRERVRSAVSLNAVLVNGARAVGPAVAGIVIALVGIGECFLINAVTFVAALIALSRMRVVELIRSEPVERTKGQLREGVRYIRRTPTLLIPLLMMVLIGTFAYEFQVVLPLFAETTFGGDATAFGLLSSAQGAGAVVGGLLVASRGRTGIAAVTLGAFCFGVTMLFAAASPTLAVAIGALAVVGAASVMFLSMGNSTLQLNSEPEFRGRVMALWSVAFLGSTPIGGPIVGFVSEQFSPRVGLGLGAVACLLAACIGLYAMRLKPGGVADDQPLARAS